jgi:SAM-dependent methyltransferase
MKLIRPSAQQLRREFEHARDIVAKTYTGLGNQQAYDLAYYDNLETIDPLGRCTYYRGTDQRDYFIPRLKQMFGQLPQLARIGDFGAGDGLTTAMALPAVRGTAVLDLVEPSPAIKSYEALIARSANLMLGASLQMGIEQLGSADGQAIADNSLDIALSLHSIYFFDIEAGVQSMYRRLKPGGSLLIVFADETRSTTGHAIIDYFNRIGHDEVSTTHREIFQKRRNLLASDSGDESLVSIIATNFGQAPIVNIHDAASRFYAEKFGNMAAFGLLSGLPFFDAPDDMQSDEFKLDKILSALTSLYENPEQFDLGIVADQTDPRCGMWTTSQPQYIVTITKPDPS